MTDAKTTEVEPYVEPLTLTLGRWLVEHDETAEIMFEFNPGKVIDSVELTLTWGPGPKQTRTYLMQSADGRALRNWLDAAFGRQFPLPDVPEIPQDGKP